MKSFYCVATWVLVALALFAGRAGAQEVQWIDAATLEIEGKGWAETATPFARLPESVKDKFSELAWDLSGDSAGIAVRFVTDAAAVRLRWSLTSQELAMPHMPATGVSGLDLYARSAGGGWKFIGNGRPGKVEGNEATIEFPDGARAGRECLLYLPLYNGTKSLEIGVEAGAKVEMPAPRPEGRRRPVVVYGTSITQGGCASRPGMAWTAIVGRMLDRPVINLGFSSAGTMQPPVADALAELDPAVFVIDCTWNMGDDQGVYMQRIGQLVPTIRKARPATPIIFVGQSHIIPESHPRELTQRQENAVRKLQEEGVKGLLLVPGEVLIGDDGEGTVDGVHMNDLGMLRQAEALAPVVSKAIGEEQVR